MTGHWRTAAVIHSSPRKTLRFFGPLARALLSTTARGARKTVTGGMLLPRSEAVKANCSAE